MFIPKYIMDMMDKIPKHKEEDIINARIPKDYTQRTSEIIPKICKISQLYPKYVKQLPNEHSYHVNN